MIQIVPFRIWMVSKKVPENPGLFNLLLNLYENLLMIVSIKESAVTGPSFLSILRIAI